MSIGRIGLARNSFAVLAALVIAICSPALGQENDPGQTLTRGSFVLRPARIIAIPAGETIRLSVDTVLAADQIKLDGSIITGGYQLHIDAREVVWGPAGRIRAFEGPPSLPPEKPQAARGPDGSTNYSLPRAMRNGRQGPSGDTGNPGIPGHPNPGPILYVVGHSANQINIDARGQEGGKGGIGGQGGAGGNGAPGRSAWASCDRWGASCVSYGAGWSGGEPGNGGPGGQGGKGGQGGNAVPLIVALGDLTRRSTDEILVGFARGGKRGDPGLPGNPGNAGTAGRADGCCASALGWPCEDCGGAPGGFTPNFASPGNLGSGDEGDPGKDVEANLPLLAPFAGVPSPFAPNGASVDLGPLYGKQAQVISAMSEFHATRTYTYLLTRSLALIGYSLPAIAAMQPDLASVGTAPRADPETAAIVAELWRTAFVNPLQGAVDSGDTSFPAIHDWLKRGRQTVQLLLEVANGPATTMPSPLAAMYRDAQTGTVGRANDAMAACQTYKVALSTVGSEAILLSHHVSIPACTELPKLTGAQLFLRPLTIHEPLPKLPDAFKPYLIASPLRVAGASNRSIPFSFAALLYQLANQLVPPAKAQVVDIQVRAQPSSATVVLPSEIGVDPKRLNGRRFLLQTSLQSDSSYSAAQLVTDLRIFSEMVR